MFSRENTDVDFYKTLLEPVNNKKALKVVLPLLEQRAFGVPSGLQNYHLIIALLDLIEWKAVLDNNNVKDNVSSVY